MHVSQQQLADVFRVSTRSIQRWGRDGLDDCRVDGGATYDLAAAVAWRIDAVQAHSDDEYRAARARRMAADADLRELTLAKERRELIHRADVLALVTAPLEAVDRELKSAPTRMARRWSKKLGVSEARTLELIEEIVEEVRSTLREMASDAEDAAA